MNNRQNNAMSVTPPIFWRIGCGMERKGRARSLLRKRQELWGRAETYFSKQRGKR